MFLKNKKIVSVSNAARLLKRTNNIMIMCHTHPDGDTLGSAYALKYALEGMKKTVCVVCDTPITKKFLFLTDNVINLVPMFIPEYVISVDIADLQLVGESLKEYIPNIFLSIDHHPTNSLYAKHNLINDKSSSTGGIIYEIIKKMKVPFTQKILDAIYIAASTDTGCFRYSNTDAKTLRLAADLVEMGANSEYLNKILFEVVSPSHVALQGLALKTLHYFSCGKIAIIRITLELIAKAKASEDDIDNISNLARNITGVEVGLSLREIAPNEYKISARSNGFVDVSYICSLFGGGGHKRAAGCLLKGEINEVEGRLVSAILNKYFSEDSNVNGNNSDN